MTPGADLAGALTAGLAASPEGSLAVSRFGIQRMNGVRSATSVMYQTLLAPSQRAPSAFTASFSAKGATRLILMGEVSSAKVPTGYPEHYARCVQCGLLHYRACLTQCSHQWLQGQFLPTARVQAASAALLYLFCSRSKTLSASTPAPLAVPASIADRSSCDFSDLSCS